MIGDSFGFTHAGTTGQDWTGSYWSSKQACLV